MLDLRKMKIKVAKFNTVAINNVKKFKNKIPSFKEIMLGARNGLTTINYYTPKYAALGIAMASTVVALPFVWGIDTVLALEFTAVILPFAGFIAGKAIIDQREINEDKATGRDRSKFGYFSIPDNYVGTWQEAYEKYYDRKYEIKESKNARMRKIDELDRQTEDKLMILQMKYDEISKKNGFEEAPTVIQIAQEKDMRK